LASGVRLTADGQRQTPVHWSLIVDPHGHPGHVQMALDAALLAAAGPGTAFLRFYRWDPPCLSFGRNEPATTRYDRDRIATLGFATVRRPTGGRAVWHDAEVTYAVAGPTSLFGSLPGTYRAIHDAIATGLRALGAPAGLAPAAGPVAPGAGACFASPAGGEVIVGGRKLVGSAQVREGHGFLQHGSILLADGQDRVAQVTRGPAPLVQATSLGEVLGRDVTFAEVSEAITAAARAAWPGTWTTAAPPAVPADNRFADPDWTWRR
jgi:lipoate-protein ligase A